MKQPTFARVHSCDVCLSMSAWHVLIIMCNSRNKVSIIFVRKSNLSARKNRVLYSLDKPQRPCRVLSSCLVIGEHVQLCICSPCQKSLHGIHSTTDPTSRDFINPCKLCLTRHRRDRHFAEMTYALKHKPSLALLRICHLEDDID